MHVASFKKMEAFFATYGDRFPVNGGRSRILEIGSKSYQDHRTYRSLVDESRHRYIGLDLERGPNVDVVPENPYVWREMDDESADVCISGQTFEHNPYFWVTMCEMARVLVPGGYACVIAPGAGAVHRYPVDCFRFYPDSWPALAALAGLEINEVYFETDEAALNVVGGQWRDSMMIAMKPRLAPDDADAARSRRQLVTQPFRDGFDMSQACPSEPGPATQRYLASVPHRTGRHLLQRIARRLSPYGVARVFKG